MVWRKAIEKRLNIGNRRRAGHQAKTREERLSVSVWRHRGIEVYVAAATTKAQRHDRRINVKA